MSRRFSWTKSMKCTICARPSENIGHGNICGKIGTFSMKLTLNSRYAPSKWKIWARAVWKKVSVIQSNAIVESLWSVLKKKYLRKYSRPKLEFLVDIIMNQQIQYLAVLIREHRNIKNPVKPHWYFISKV